MIYCNCPACLTLMAIAIDLTAIGDHVAADRVAAMVTVLDEQGNAVPYAAAPIADRYVGEGYTDPWSAPMRDDVMVN